MPEQSVRPEDFIQSDISKQFVESMEAFVKKYENRLFRIALAMMGNKADAEDMVQEVFVKVIEKRPAFESPEHETAWLIRVTVNQCKSRLRSVWWRRTEPLLDSFPAQSPEEHRLMETVLSLTPKYRTVIHLFYYEGYSAAEIAAITGQKESTVRSLLTRARQKLRNIVKEEEI